MLADCPTAIEEIINILQTEQLPNIDSNSQLWILFEILGGIPEEVSGLNDFWNEKKSSFHKYYIKCLELQINAIYTSVQRVGITSEMSKRTPLVVNIAEQYILSKCDTDSDSDEMVSLLKAVKCTEAWMVYVLTYTYMYIFNIYSITQLLISCNMCILQFMQLSIGQM